MAMAMLLSKGRVVPSLIQSFHSLPLFNRTKEMDLIQKRLNVMLNIHVLNGPVNSGKSMLLRELTQKLSDTSALVLHVKLRSTSFNTVDTVVWCPLQR